MEFLKHFIIGEHYSAAIKTRKNAAMIAFKLLRDHIKCLKNNLFIAQVLL